MPSHGDCLPPRLTRAQRSASSATLPASSWRLVSASSWASTALSAGAESLGRKKASLRCVSSCRATWDQRAGGCAGLKVHEHRRAGELGAYSTRNMQPCGQHLLPSSLHSRSAPGGRDPPAWPPLQHTPLPPLPSVGPQHAARCCPGHPQLPRLRPKPAAPQGKQGRFPRRPAGVVGVGWDGGCGLWGRWRRGGSNLGAQAQ